MKNWLDFCLAWSVASKFRSFCCLRMGREIHEKLLDLPDGLVFFSTADVEIDEPEGREIAGKVAWKGAPDLLQGFLVGCPVGQLGECGYAHLLLGLRFPRPLRQATPEWRGSCRFFARRSRRSAAELRVLWRHLLTDYAGRSRSAGQGRGCPSPHGLGPASACLDPSPLSWGTRSAVAASILRPPHIALCHAAQHRGGDTYRRADRALERWPRKRRSMVTASSALPASIRRFAWFSVGWLAGLAGPVSA